MSICTVPWDDAGAYLRFSVTYEAADEAAAAIVTVVEEKMFSRIEEITVYGKPLHPIRFQ